MNSSKLRKTPGCTENDIENYKNQKIKSSLREKKKQPIIISILKNICKTVKWCGGINLALNLKKKSKNLQYLQTLKYKDGNILKTDPELANEFANHFKSIQFYS